MNAPTTTDTARARAEHRCATHVRLAGSETDERREGEVPVPFPSDAYYHPNLPPRLHPRRDRRRRHPLASPAVATTIATVAAATLVAAVATATLAAIVAAATLASPAVATAAATATVATVAVAAAVATVATATVAAAAFAATVVRRTRTRTQTRPSYSSTTPYYSRPHSPHHRSFCQSANSSARYLWTSLL